MFNALRAARMRGIPSAGLISARGGDTDGNAIAAAIGDAGIEDLSAIFLDRRSASYTAILDEHRDVVSGLADMDIYEHALPRQLRRKALRETVASAGAVLIDANVPPAALLHIASISRGPIFAMAISPAKSVRLLPVASQTGLVFLNQRELGALTGGVSGERRYDALRGLGFARAIITDGAQRLTVMDVSGLQEVSVPPIEKVVDVTGAGDALAGATIAALLTDPPKPLVEAVRDGIAAAQITLQYSGPVAPALNGADFEAIRRSIEVPDGTNSGT